MSVFSRSAEHKEQCAGDRARIPDGMAFDAAGNLYVACYVSDNVYKVSARGKLQRWAYDPAGTLIARPTNVAFGGQNFDQMFFANLGQWHVCHAPGGVRGQRLANQR
jgi:gluconolactonase